MLPSHIKPLWLLEGGFGRVFSYKPKHQPEKWNWQSKYLTQKLPNMFPIIYEESQLYTNLDQTKAQPFLTGKFFSELGRRLIYSQPRHSSSLVWLTP